MEKQNWDDPIVEKRWCGERRQVVTEYLSRQGLHHGQVGIWPAWHIAPYISLWAIESLRAPGVVGWWAISGDLPNDCLSAATIKHPREAVLAFANAWQSVAAHIAAGVPHKELRYEAPEADATQAAALERCSNVLRQLATEESLWDGKDFEPSP